MVAAKFKTYHDYLKHHCTSFQRPVGEKLHEQLRGLPGRTTYHFYMDFPTGLKWCWRSCSQLAPAKMKRLWFRLNLKH